MQLLIIASEFACKLIGFGKASLEVSCGCIEDCECSNDWNYLVMQLLGSNIAELRKKREDGRFSLSTTSLILTQMLRAIKSLHDVGYLHRDIKPSNFALGLETTKQGEPFYGRPLVFMIDFGLARRYISSEGKPREPRDKAGFRGTARYASLHAHQRKEMGRRDDLWSLFYVMVEFLEGKLPWRKEKEKDVVGKMKQSMHSVELVRNLPDACSRMFKHLESLQYRDIPDYALIEECFNELFELSGEARDVPYDWDRSSVEMRKTSFETLATDFPLQEHDTKSDEVEDPFNTDIKPKPPAVPPSEHRNVFRARLNRINFFLRP